MPRTSISGEELRALLAVDLDAAASACIDLVKAKGDDAIEEFRKLTPAEGRRLRDRLIRARANAYAI